MSSFSISAHCFFAFPMVLRVRLRLTIRAVLMRFVPFVEHMNGLIALS